LAYGAVTLRKQREKPAPHNPQTLGEHIRRRRLELRLTQRAAGQVFGVSRDALAWWENGTRNPEPAHVRAILEFLGYDPRPEPSGFAEELRFTRYRLGHEQAAFATALSVPLPTLRAWECRCFEPAAGRMAAIRARMAVLASAE